MIDGTKGWTEQDRVGRWWLPTEPAVQVGGRLLVAPDGEVTIELAGGLGGPPDFAAPVILGALSDGRAVTLEDARTTRRSDVSSVQTGATTWASLRANAAYIGGHLPSEADRTFDEALIEVEDLLSWIAYSPISQVLDELPGQQGVRYTRPPEVVAETLIGSVNVIHWAEPFGAADNELGLRAHAAFLVKAREPHDLDWWQRQAIRPLELLMTTVVGRPNHATSVDLTSGDHTVNVVYRQSTRRATQPRQVFEFTVLRTWLGHDLAPFIASWFELIRAVRPSINLRAAGQYLPGYVETEFLDFVYALEGYHRRRYPNRVLSTVDHRARVQALTAAAPEPHREWLRQRLAYSNEPTLAARLNPDPPTAEA